ncbi:hypothetical protein [Streptomyces sp. NPDC048196]|uniref:hypothetical protein n=1 Tax=Streptomyces sp. NPDC048196 TaxID=3154712 RepID=UPI0033D8748F
MNKLLKSAAMVATTAAVAVCSLAATAPTALADGSQACTRDDRNRTAFVTDLNAPIHAEPSGSSKVVNYGWKSFSIMCSKPGGSHRWWYGYGGPSRDTRGWIWGAYVTK